MVTRFVAVTITHPDVQPRRRIPGVMPLPRVFRILGMVGYGR